MSLEEVQDMENRIIEVAKQVFIRKGFEATKMGDVATEVGISRTAMHYYFRTKEMLFEAVFGQLMGTLLPNIEAIVDEPTTCLEKIPKIVGQYVHLMQTNPSFPVFVVNEFNRDPEHLYQTVLKDPSRITPILRLQKQILDEMEKGMIKKMPLVYIVSTLMALVAFPMLASHPIMTIFFEGNKAHFNDFISERKTFVSDLIVQMLTPNHKYNV